MSRQTNGLNNLPKFQNPPLPPEKCVDYYQVDESSYYFGNLQQIKNALELNIDIQHIIEGIDESIELGYDLFDGTLYEFMYNPCYHESVSRTVSIHLTRKGAEEAMEDHKTLVKAEFDDIYYNPEYPVDFVVENMKWDDDKFWSINETKIEK